jgi:hypothetical protein
MLIQRKSLVSHEDKEVNASAVLDPTSAQIQMWLAQAKRDHGDLSGRELGKIEGLIGGAAKRSRTLYNPFTGEIRKVEI